MHCPQYVGLCRLAHGILLVIGQEYHVLSLVIEMAVKICAHVLYVVDATTKLSTLTKVVDADEESFPASVASRILERVAIWRTVTEALWCGRGRGRAAGAVVLLLCCIAVSQRVRRRERRAAYGAVHCTVAGEALEVVLHSLHHIAGAAGSVDGSAWVLLQTPASRRAQRTC